MDEWYRVAWRGKNTRMTGYEPGAYPKDLATTIAQTKSGATELFFYWPERIPEGAVMLEDGRWRDSAEQDND